MLKRILLTIIVVVFYQVLHAADFTNFIGMKFNKISAGEFIMGSCQPKDGKTEEKTGFLGLQTKSVCLSGGKVDIQAAADEMPQHKVRISRSFQMGVHEVTLANYKAFLEDTGRVVSENFKKHNSQGEDKAVVWVSWFQVQSFINWLNSKKPNSDLGIYRLPTEAEWEFAARAGTKEHYFFGDSSSEISRFAWIIKDSQSFGQIWSRPVGLKQPNPWGLYDIYGNVWEWTQDVYSAEYYATSPVLDPKGPETGPNQVVRGCSLYTSAKNCRSAKRHFAAADKTTGSIGFRLVRQLP